VTLFFKTRDEIGDLHQDSRMAPNDKYERKHIRPSKRQSAPCSSQAHATLKDTTDDALEYNLAITRDHITVRVKYFQTRCNEQ